VHQEVSIEALLLSCTIDAMEERYIAILDISGAFMKADMNDTLHLKIEGRLTELLVSPSYIKIPRCRKWKIHKVCEA